MNKRRGLKKFLMLAGLAALFVGGYLVMSVATSCRSEAFLCCQSNCISAFDGISVALARISLQVTTPALAIATASVAAYYAVAMASFVARAIFAISMVINGWVGWWDTFWYYNVNPALQDMTTQLVAINAEQARAIGAFADMVERNRAIRQVREQEVRSLGSQAPGENVCVAGTVTGGLVRGEHFSRAYETAATKEALNRTMSSGAQARTPNVDIRERYQRYVERYCHPDENAGAADCDTPAPFAGLQADVTGQIFMKDTIDLRDPDVKQTVDDIVTNIAEPFLVKPVDPAVYGAPQGQRYILQLESYKAKRQVVYDALYHVVARRAPGTGMGEFLREMRLEAGHGGGVDPVTGDTIAPNPDIADPNYNPSRNEVIQVMAAERYRTPQYAARLIDEPENVAREHVIQEAVNIMQMSDILDMMDRYSLIVAARVGDSVNSAMKTSEVDAVTPVGSGAY